MHLTQARDTITATRRLIEAVQARALPLRLVLASSITVYSAQARGVVTEATPIEDRPEQRNAYANAKIAQEKLLRPAANDLNIGETLALGSTTVPIATRSICCNRPPEPRRSQGCTRG